MERDKQKHHPPKPKHQHRPKPPKTHRHWRNRTTTPFLRFLFIVYPKTTSHSLIPFHHSIHVSNMGVVSAISVAAGVAILVVVALVAYQGRGGIPGGKTALPYEETKVLVGRALDELYAQQKDDEPFLVPVEIVSATRQVVSGVLYELKLIVVKSPCSKKQLEEADAVARVACATPEKDAKRFLYSLKVYEQPWTNTFKVEVESVADIGVVSYY